MLALEKVASGRRHTSTDHWSWCLPKRSAFEQDEEKGFFLGRKQASRLEVVEKDDREQHTVLCEDAEMSNRCNPNFIPAPSRTVVH